MVNRKTTRVGLFLISSLAIISFSGCGGPIIFNQGLIDEYPVADPGPDQVVLAGSEVFLDGSLSFDPAGSPLLFYWEQIAGPLVFLDAPFEPITAFFADVPGDYQFLLTVENDLGLTDSRDVIVTAIP